MTLGTSGADQHRHRTALAFVGIGGLLLVFAWGTWLYRTSLGTMPAPQTPPGVASPTGDGPGGSEGPTADRREAAVRAAPFFLLIVFLLVLLVLFGGYAIVRVARRYLAATDRRRGPPTPSDDVWTVHTTPGSNDDERR